MTTPQQDLARIARAVVDANSYLTLATADRAGRPWPSGELEDCGDQA